MDLDLCSGTMMNNAHERSRSELTDRNPWTSLYLTARGFALTSYGLAKENNGNLHVIYHGGRYV